MSRYHKYTEYKFISNQFNFFLSVLLHREHNLREKTEQTKVSKTKPTIPYKEKEDSQHHETNLNTIVQRALKKTIPLTKSKSTKNCNSTIGDGPNIKDEIHHCQRSKSRGYQNSHPHRHGKGDQLYESQVNARQISANEMEFSKLIANAEAFKRNSYSRRLHRSALALNKEENDLNKKMDSVGQHTPPPTIKSFLRDTKSEVIPLNKSIGGGVQSAAIKNRICYERQIEKLEEEVELYKKEVRNFCRETLKNSQQKQVQQRSNEEIRTAQSFGRKSTPKSRIATNSSPIKNIYLQLLAQGQRKDYNKSDLDLSVNSRSGNGSSYNSNTCSGRSKLLQTGHNNKNTNRHLSNQQLVHNQNLSHQYRTTMTLKPQSQQYCCQPLSKFI